MSSPRVATQQDMDSLLAVDWQGGNHNALRKILPAGQVHHADQVSFKVLDKRLVQQMAVMLAADDVRHFLGTAQVQTTRHAQANRLHFDLFVVDQAEDGPCI